MSANRPEMPTSLARRDILLTVAAAALIPAAAGAQTAPPPPLALPPLPAGSRAIEDIVFVQRDTGALKLDLYLPAGAGPHPLIVWIHGGGWFAGDRTNPAARHFLTDNYAVASIDYRLSGQAAFPAPLLDCKAAIRFLRSHAGAYGLDIHRFIACGPMSGGHLASLLGVTAGRPEFAERLDLSKDDRVQGVMTLYAVQDFIAWRGGEHDQPESSESRMLGGFILDRPDLARAANPTTYVSRQAPPYLLIHGRRDERVPWTQSKLMDSALRLAGVDSELWIEEQAVHADPSFWSESSRARMTRFFNRTLAKS